MKLFSSFVHLGCATLARPWGMAFEQKENRLKTRNKYMRGEGIEYKYKADYDSGTEATINNRALLEMQDMNATQDLLSSLTEELQAQANKELDCAWGLSALGGELTFKSAGNIAFPDLNSNYWLTPILIKDIESSKVVITGKAPEARYFSFQTYSIEDLLSTTIGALTDVDIVTDVDGRFTILVNNGDDVEDLNVNSLRGLPEGQTQGIILLMYRTYVSVPFSSPAGGVKLPKIAIERFGGELRELSYCGDAEPMIDVPEPAQYETLVQKVEAPRDGALNWFRPPGQFTPFPNEDVAYLVTAELVTQFEGYAVVMRGKAPTFEDENMDDPEDPQVRFWSVCKLASPSTKTISCIRDDQANLDSEGRYVIVVAPEAPSGEGFDYLNFGPGPLGAMVLRNMLPSEDFLDMAVQNVDRTDDDGTIRNKMGAFYPEAVYCSVSRIEEDGVEACF